MYTDINAEWWPNYGRYSIYTVAFNVEERRQWQRHTRFAGYELNGESEDDVRLLRGSRCTC
jgi:hypothetical protein